MFVLSEIIDIVLMTLATGFVFSDMFGKKRHVADVVDLYKQNSFLDWEAIKFAAMVTAPAIILHELGHKFLAMGFGMNATFHAAYFWLGLAVVAKMMRFPFLFFVPAYVSISGAGTSLEYSLAAAAGPFVNIAIWGLATLYLKFGKPKRKHIPVLVLTQRINLFLSIFNLLPIPGFDGFQFFTGLIRAFT